MIVADFEIFKMDWLMVGIDPIEQKEYVIVNDKQKLEEVYNKYKHDIWVGYNFRGFDQYILKAILLGFDPKRVNDWIIVKKRKGWEFTTMFNKLPLYFFDVMPNPPIGLKTLEGFMGVNIHETSVPFDLNRKLTPKEIEETIKYCRFDVLNTIEVFLKRKSEFDAQMDLLKAFHLPLSCLGKTQAQLAAIIFDAKKVRFKDDWDIRLPDNADLGKYKCVGDWFLDPKNHTPDATCDLEIAGLTHTIAWGGIHAGIPKTIVECADDEQMFDADVAQLYPNIMRIYNLLSRAARKPEMLGYILDTSLRLKAEGKKKEREPYKRQCNICYGAEGDHTNKLYDPLHRSLVCVYGQVFLVDLIDKIEQYITLINSNTDGIFFKVKRKDFPKVKELVHEWEERTGLVMEFDEYVRFISKDVNNYLAVSVEIDKKTGFNKIHAKGAYLKDLNDLDYDLPIVNEALRNYMIFGTPVETTVNACTDFRKFQKIVKLSDKYKWVEHEQGEPRLERTIRHRDGSCTKIYKYDKTVKYDNKAYRVFASNDPHDGTLLKCDGIRNPAKFGNTPEHCFICNDNVQNMEIPKKLDKQYYIDKAKERLGDFGL